MQHWTLTMVFGFFVLAVAGCGSSDGGPSNVPLGAACANDAQCAQGLVCKGWCTHSCAPLDNPPTNCESGFACINYENGMAGSAR